MTVEGDLLNYLGRLKGGIAAQPQGFRDDVLPLLESLYAGQQAGNVEREWERVGKAIVASFPGLGVASWDDVPAIRKYIYTREEFHELQAAPPALKTGDGKTILIGKGQVLVYAPTMSFKSFIALRWANQLAAEGKRVLFCEGERFEPFAKRSRAHDSYYSVTERGTLHFADVLAMHLDGTGIGLVRGLAPSYDVVFVDTFRSAINPEDENSNSEIGRWLRELRKLASLVVVIHHTNKGGEEYAGAGAFATNTDAQVKVGMVEGVKLLRKISVEQNDDESHDDLHYQLLAHASSLVAVELDADQVAGVKARNAAAKSEKNKFEKDELYLKALKDGPATKAELAEETGDSEKTVHRWLQGAIKRQIVTEDGKDGRAKRFRATKAGDGKIPF